MNTRIEKSNEIIRQHVLWSMGAGAIPLPIIDMAAVTGVQLDMLRQISNLYHLDYSENTGKTVISAIAGSTLAKLGSSFIKAIPGVGALLGGISMSALSGASTYAMGQVFVNHLENGGNWFNFDMEKAKKEYGENFEKGQQYATDLEKKSKEPTQGEVFNKLDELVKLKKEGVITEEDFQRKKDELLKKLYGG